MTLPNFFLVGASKCGTTSLYHYLRQHPDVFLPALKEPQYFAYAPDAAPRERRHRPIDSFAHYEDLFAPVTTEHAIGEASARYLGSPVAAAQIAAVQPDARIIVLVREPVSRAFSAYLQARRRGIEQRSFRDAVAADLASTGPWYERRRYVEGGCYVEPIERFLGAFGADRVRIHLHEDLDRTPHAVLADIFAFLAVDPAFTPDVSQRCNTAALPTSRRAARWLTAPGPIARRMARVVPPAARTRVMEGLVQANRRPAPSLPAAAATWLSPYFADDVAALEVLLNRDLSAWRASWAGAS